MRRQQQVYEPFTAAHRDALIARSLSRPQRNIDGDLGPRCHPCSGLGELFRPRVAFASSAALVGECTATSRCVCHGSGIDLARLEQQDREQLWKHLARLQSVYREGPLSTYKLLPMIKLSRQYWMETIAWATADGTPVANNASEAILFPNVVIPANYMQDGRGLRLRVQGKYSTTTGTVSHVYRVRWNGVSGTVLCQTGTVTLLVSMTNAYFDLDLTIQTRSNGSAGTLLADGIARAFGGTAPTIGSATGAPAVAPMTAGGQTAPATASVDLTADTPLAVTIQHGAANASNTATGQHYTIESLN